MHRIGYTVTHTRIQSLKTLSDERRIPARSRSPSSFPSPEGGSLRGVSTPPGPCLPPGPARHSVDAENTLDALLEGGLPPLRPCRVVDHGAMLDDGAAAATVQVDRVQRARLQ